MGGNEEKEKKKKKKVSASKGNGATRVTSLDPTAKALYRTQVPVHAVVLRDLMPEPRVSSSCMGVQGVRGWVGKEGGSNNWMKMDGCLTVDWRLVNQVMNQQLRDVIQDVTNVQSWAQIAVPLVYHGTD